MSCHTRITVQKIAALQSAANLLSEREKRTRLLRELAKLNPKEEQQLAEEGLGEAWPEY
jgi:hypothetical protein